jgi:hypothetical protein
MCSRRRHTVDAVTIDRLNILQATMQAMLQAAAAVGQQLQQQLGRHDPTATLADGRVAAQGTSNEGVNPAQEHQTISSKAAVDDGLPCGYEQCTHILIDGNRVPKVEADVFGLGMAVISPVLGRHAPQALNCVASPLICDICEHAKKDWAKHTSICVSTLQHALIFNASHMLTAVSISECNAFCQRLLAHP